MRVTTGLALMITGVGVGTALGFLYAPQNGKATRKVVSKKTAEGYEFLSERSRDILGQAQDILDRGREIASKCVA